MGAEILTDHRVLIEKTLVSELNSVKLLLQPLNVLLFCHFHLLEDFLLRVKFTVEVLSAGYCFVDLMLEFQVLFLEDLNLTVCGIKLDFGVFEGQDLIFELTTSLQEA